MKIFYLKSILFAVWACLACWCGANMAARAQESEEKPKTQQVTENFPNGKPKIVREVIYDEKKKQVNHGLWKRFHPTGKVAEQGNFQQGKAEGLFHYFHQDGTLAKQGSFKAGKADGVWKAWHTNGKPDFVGEYQNGQAEGVWNYWHPTEKLARKGEYRAGKAEGIWTYWHPDGNISQRGTLRDGLRVGEFLLWYPSGAKQAVAHYDAAGRQAHWLHFYETGEKKEEGFERDGRRQGVWQSWFPDGQLSLAGTYLNGRETGTWTAYFPNGKVSTTATYGTANEPVKWAYWNEAGKPVKEGAYLNRKAVGMWTYYHPSGSRSMSGEYVNGLRHGTWTFWDMQDQATQQTFNQGQPVKKQEPKPEQTKAETKTAEKPNVIVVFVDNFGNGDLGCFGSKLHRTPHVDRLAAEGTKFTSFYVASGVCTPSRAALMTGCYPRRVNLHISDKNSAVLQPIAAKGLNPDEQTLAEVLKGAGYATACIGKWHLGDQPAFLPTRQGFDQFFGIPYSDDMTGNKRPGWPELPLMRNDRVISAPADRDLLVKQCTEEAVKFIEQNHDRPFFLYLPHTMPGSTPHPFSSPDFRGKSANGEYGDAVEELDWSTGQIVETLRKLKLDRRTMIVWTSDNGAVQRTPPQGSSAPYQGFGYDTSEGAMRMPCVMWWPGQIAANQTNDSLCSTLDLLPTLAHLCQAPLPTAAIDGHDIRPVIMNEAGAVSPWDEKGFCYYRMDQLQAVRAGPWKLYLPLEKKYISLGRKTAPSVAALYNVRTDVGETREVSAEHPDVVKKLMEMAQRTRAEIGDVDQAGAGQRPAGWVKEPQPLLPAQ